MKSKTIQELKETEIGKWGDIATLEYGKGIRDYKKKSGKYRVFGTNGPIGWHDEYLCNHESIIVGRKGAYRGIHFSENPFYVIDTAFFLKPKTKFDIKWAYYELLTHDINTMDSGSAIPSTTRADFYRLQVKIPTFEEQVRLGDFFWKIDLLIKTLQNQNKILEQIAQSIFKSWFVDFDGVTEFEDSELGKIPKGWSVEKLENICNIVTGKLNSNAAVNDGKYSFFTCAKENFKTNTYSYDCEAILLAGNNAMGDFSVKYFSGKFDVYQRTYVITLKNLKSIGYFYLLLSIKRALKHFQSISLGTATKFLTMSILEPFPILTPNETIIKKFNKIANPILQQISKNDSELVTLTKTRDALLPKLMSGEIRV